MTQKSSGFFNWINSRLPIVNTYERHLSKHPVPKKVNFWCMFGALASVVLIIQIVSGIWLMFGYENTEEGAFASIEYIMERRQFGKPIAQFDTTIGKVADMIVGTFSADCMTYRTVGMIQDAVDDLDKTDPNYYIMIKTYISIF